MKKSLNNYINELMNEKIKLALNNDSIEEAKNIDLEIAEKNKKTQVLTTSEELEAYVIVRTLLSNIVNVKDINYKDTGRYFAIIYKNKVTRWICRFYLNSPNNKYVELNVQNKENARFNIKSIYDIKNVKKELENIIYRFL